MTIYDAKSAASVPEGITCGSWHQLAAYSVLLGVGAGRGSRTPKTRRSADFESAASASSAIPALLASAWFYDLFMAMLPFHPK